MQPPALTRYSRFSVATSAELPELHIVSGKRSAGHHNGAGGYRGSIPEEGRQVVSHIIPLQAYTVRCPYKTGTLNTEVCRTPCRGRVSSVPVPYFDDLHFWIHSTV